MMKLNRRRDDHPMPAELLEWQVRLRHHTAHERGGSPHVGVAPLLTVRRPGTALGVVTHSIICGILPAPEHLAAKTAEFRDTYERNIPRGARAAYDAGIELLKTYYTDAAMFDPSSLSTLVAEDSAVVHSLRAEPRCSLLFYVFNLERQSDLDRFRCLHIDAHAEVLRDGPVYENVWWHNTLFHGKAENSVVIRFRHQRTVDTAFGGVHLLA
jgi:hypothetical protein